MNFNYPAPHKRMFIGRDKILILMTLSPLNKMTGSTIQTQIIKFVSNKPIKPNHSSLSRRNSLSRLNNSGTLPSPTDPSQACSIFCQVSPALYPCHLRLELFDQDLDCISGRQFTPQYLLNQFLIMIIPIIGMKFCH